ncbi:MAG TPA: hypothetical protein VII11_02475 [Bacteroidota bacterium]
MKLVRRVILFLFIACIASSWAQQADKNYDDLKKEIALIRAQLDSLKTLQRSAPVGVDDELETLAESIEKRLKELEQKIDAIARSTALVVFNPRLTAFLNVAARRDDHPVLDEEGGFDISNRPYLRSIELDFRAPVDPYAEAILILAVEDEAGEGFAVEPEEAYGILKRLPILESAPLGMKVRVGKFRSPLGVNNKLHMHDMPWTTRPLVVSRLFGTEHGDFFESGHAPVGVDFDFFLPTVIPGSTFEMNLDVVRGGELRVSQEHEGGRVGYIGHVNLSADWRNEHLVVLGASAYRERGESLTDLFGVDFTYKWSPTENRAARSFVAGGEWYTAKHEYNEPGGEPVIQKPSGWFAYAQYQLSYWWYVGARYDWVKEPYDDRLVTKAWSGYFSYYTTEFLRLRAGIDHRRSDIPGFEKLTSVNVEINFVFGSHPVEPYWVNR